MNYLDELNPVQRDAVLCTEGPVMIIAGPGSGKTRVLTYRIAHLMETGVDPFNILALTFTNKAAREMNLRITSLHGNEARNLWMGTFHSIFSRILRREAPKIGYPNNFTIYDAQDSKSVIKTIVKEQGLDEKLYKPNSVFFRISSVKNSLISVSDYLDNEFLMGEDESNNRPELSRLYQLYVERCFKAGAMDFDDLLFRMHELLESSPEVLYKYQHYFRYIMIDEFQDTNHVQYVIVRRLADVFQNIAVVGDDAQSIYSFRGANIQNILNFEKDYSDLKIFKLEQNYRSTNNIVKAANHIIANNKRQLTKEIWTENIDGQAIKVIKAMSDNEEGKLVAEAIFDLKMREHVKNMDIAILYRTNAQSRSFEESLRRLNIPYRIYGGISFYQRKEVKDLLAYFKLTINPKDEEALRRIINYPARGIGKSSLEQMAIATSKENKSLWEVACHIEKTGVNTRSRKTISQFVQMIESFRAMMDRKNAYDLASHIARSSGLLKELYSDKSVEGVSRYENLQELLNSIQEFTVHSDEVIENQPIPEDKSLGSYLQQVSLLTDLDEEQQGEDKVKLMTIHAAKGLEFSSVFVVGLEENLFPSMLSMNSREDLEEERRLFYVSVTRAEKFLFLTHAASRYRFGSLIYCEPSRFLDEIPELSLEYVGYRHQKPKRKEKPSQDRPSEKIRRSKLKNIPYIHKASPNFTADDPQKLMVGMEVEHQRFGFGKIISLEGNNPNRIATVFFKEQGQKKLLLKFAKLRIHRMSEL